MRAYVFTDKSLGRYAGRFVWLAVNTEEAKNAAFLAKYPIPALPTMLVLDPSGSKIVYRYVGGATVGQLTKILDDASRKTGSAADQIVAEADRLASEKRHLEAVKAYEKALAEAPKGWARYGRTAESLLFSYSMTDQQEQCAEKALSLLPRLKGTTSGAMVAAAGLGCAGSLEPTNPHRGELMVSLEKKVRAALDDPKLDLSADDRSGLYISLIDVRESLKDIDAAHKLMEEWAVFLETSAAAAKTPEQRAVYDSHRLTAYLELRTPEKAIAMLQQSEKDFPDDYNPPARLAMAYDAMTKYDEALAASDRALARAYGPRKLTILRGRAEIYLHKGDKQGARKTIEDAIAYLKQLPREQQSSRTMAALEKKLESIAQ